MFEIKEEFSLKNYNTFGLDVKCAHYAECKTDNELKDFLKLYSNEDNPVLILGGGSNILFTDNFKGYVVKLNIKGIEIVEETNDYVIIKVGAGEVWDELVAYCVDRNWGGMENLSHIPGNVGASPIQNIGAYGVEVKDILTEVNAIEIDTLKTRLFTRDDCHFGYRDSIFKKELKGKYIITHVTFKLQKKAAFNLDYGNLREEIKKCGEFNLKNIRQAVIHIRDSKLPRVEEFGNTGSFFKNPVVTENIAHELRKEYPNMPVFELGGGMVKIPAGWLIEEAGWKGKRKGSVGIHEKQALVLINYGNATGSEILHMARNIQQTILMKFGIELEIEVNVI